MNRHDANLWRQATTLQDLCELTAQWLEGRIKSQPGYHGECDVDEALDLKEALIALNRAGFLTEDSQEGADGKGWDGAHWEQNAAVSGFCSLGTFGWLHEELDRHGFLLTCRPIAGEHDDYTKAIPVTRRNGHTTTVYGVRASEATLRQQSHRGLSRDGLDAVCEAFQVTVWDPLVGKNDLWPVLRRIAEQCLAKAGAR